MAKRRKRSDCRIYLYDECPRVGTGWRGVRVRKLGSKWAYLTETTSGTNFKLPLTVFERARA